MTDYEAIAAILNDALGEGLYDEDLLRDSEEHGYLATVYADGEIIGAGTARLLDEGDDEIFELIGYERPSGLAGYLESAALKPAFRGLGYGRELLEARLDWMREQDCESVWACAWPSREEHDSRHLLERSGFTIYGRAQFWREVSCVFCGDDCICVGALMGMSL